MGGQRESSLGRPETVWGMGSSSLGRGRGRTPCRRCSGAAVRRGGMGASCGERQSRAEGTQVAAGASSPSFTFRGETLPRVLFSSPAEFGRLRTGS